MENEKYMNVLHKIKQSWLIVLPLTIVCILYALPFLKNIRFLGHLDWDQYFFWHEVARVAIAKYHQFPLWNPWAGGGSVLLAHPQSCFFSPLFLCTLFFGAIVGVKIEIVLLFVIGISGMYYLLRILYFSKMGALFGAIVYACNGTFSLHLSEGHVEWALCGLIPWILVLFMKSMQKRVALILAGFLLAVIFLSCDAYLFIFLLLFLFILTLTFALKEKNVRWIGAFILLTAWFLGFSMIKLIPSIEFYLTNPRIKNSSYDPVSINVLKKMFFSTQQKKYYQSTTDEGNYGMVENEIVRKGWHEYGAYMGIIPFLLIFIGLFRKNKVFWFIPSFAFFFFLVRGDSALINVWWFLQRFPVFDGLQLPSRNVIFLVIIASLFTAHGFDTIFSPKLKKSVLSKKIFLCLGALLIVYVCADMMYVHWSVMKDTFSIPFVQSSQQGSPSSFFDYVDWSHRPSRSNMLSMLSTNRGTINSYEVMTVSRGNIKESKWNNSAFNQWMLRTRQGGGVSELEKSFTPLLGLNQSYFFIRDITESPALLKTYFYSPEDRKGKLIIRKAKCVYSIYVNGKTILSPITQVKKVTTTDAFDIRKGFNSMQIHLLSRGNCEFVVSRVVNNQFVLYEDIFYNKRKEFIEKKETVLNPDSFGITSKAHFTVSHYKFSPNVVEVNVALESDAYLSLNQNYYNGWKVRVTSDSSKAYYSCVPNKGLTSIFLKKGTYELMFFYLPISVIVGGICTLLTFCLGILCCVKKRSIIHAKK